MIFHLTLTTVLLAMLAMATVSGAAASEQDRGAAATRTILILNSERPELPAIQDFERGLREGITNIAAVIEREHAAGRALSAGMTRIPVHYDYRRTLGLALALQPDAREVVASRVPEDAQISFREPGLWERYPVVTVLVILLLQALLITGLLLQVERRRRAEAALRESEERLKLAAEAARVDVTERKRSKDALRVALEVLPTPILMVNQQGTIVLSNAQAQTLLGYQAADLAGQPVEILVPERFRDGHPGHRASFFSEPAARRMGAGRALFARRKNGTEVPIEIGLNPVAAGDQLLVLAAMVDLTERQELVRRQTELEHITRVATLGELAPSLAHELSQPLSAILSNAQAGLRLLDRGALDAAEMRDILEDVVAADKRAGDVIGVLRVMMRRGKTEQVRVDVAQAVREVLGVLHGELVHEQVEVETALDGQCVALASRTQLEQVLLNLITNASEAMRPQPPGERRLRITVSPTADGGSRVAIVDSGIGIAEGELPHVFEAFRTTKPHGMGMGLAVCRSIISALGGDIRIEPNAAPGVTLVFTLPAPPPG